MYCCPGSLLPYELGAGPGPVEAVSVSTDLPKCPSDRGVSLRDLPEDLKIPPRVFRGPMSA